MSKIGERIRRARKSAGLSQEELSDKIRVNRSYLSLVENGKSSPTFEFLEKVASGLEVRVEDLVVGRGQNGSEPAELDDTPVCEGLAELLEDEEQMLLMNPSPEELRILRSIRVDTRFRPSKRFFVEALLDFRKNRHPR
ncbi:helix-turn-helix transcriptional regulator [bacterium]|nr:helix-turn-helix transcriptional regulator [bacterium]MBU1983607.1 helix-turn-helix transcriptional regulator [bacterium]